MTGATLSKEDAGYMRRQQLEQLIQDEVKREKVKILNYNSSPINQISEIFLNNSNSYIIV
jgi:hypothetical protein